MKAFKPERIELANRVLATFCTIELCMVSRKLRSRWPKWRQPGYHSYPAVTTSEGTWPRYGYDQRPCGGTVFQALAQLIHYVRDRPRLPLRSWKWWFSDACSLARQKSDEAFSLLESSDYSEKTQCLFCGTADYHNGLGWWSLDGKTGPVCLRGECAESRRRQSV